MTFFSFILFNNGREDLGVGVERGSIAAFGAHAMDCNFSDVLLGRYSTCRWGCTFYLFGWMPPGLGTRGLGLPRSPYSGLWYSTAVKAPGTHLEPVSLHPALEARGRTERFGVEACLCSNSSLHYDICTFKSRTLSGESQASRFMTSCKLLLWYETFWGNVKCSWASRT